MPSPVGHALGGLIVGWALDRRPSRRAAHGGTPFDSLALAQGREVSPATAGATVSDRPTAVHGGTPFDSLALAQGRKVPPSSRGAIVPVISLRRWASSIPLMSALAACLPDVDFLWGRHNMETHSIAFAAILGLAVYVWQRSPRVALACALAVASHVLFDWLGSDTTPPLGITALWPFSNEFYFANAFVFEAISRRYWLPNFVSHNLLAIVRELALLLPLAALMCFLRHRRVAN
jgi:membrane-bound metal-dependent hydrolase YbcI (DUF457 family)